MSKRNTDFKCVQADHIPHVSSEPRHGNTYEITIQPWDHVIVKVQHPEMNSIVTHTKISPLGISIEASRDSEKMVYKSDFSIRSLTDYQK